MTVKAGNTLWQQALNSLCQRPFKPSHPQLPIAVFARGAGGIFVHQVKMR